MQALERILLPHNSRRMPLQSYTNGSIATTWMISYMAVRVNSGAAMNLLLLWARLDNKSLWHGLLATASRNLMVVAERTAEWLGDMVHSELEYIRAVGTLQSFSLVEEMEDRTGHSTHPVMHQWTLHMQDESQRAALSWLAIALVGLAVPRSREKRYWEMQTRLLPHAEQCNKKIGEAITDQAENQKAGRQETDKKALLLAIHSLALLYEDRGKSYEAEKMYMRALEGKEKVLGAEHPSTLNTVDNLGKRPSAPSDQCSMQCGGLPLSSITSVE